MATTLLLAVLVALACAVPQGPFNTTSSRRAGPPGPWLNTGQQNCQQQSGDCNDQFDGQCIKKISASRCNKIIYDVDCGNSCRCCIDCDDASCPNSVNGVCKLECMDSEFTVEDCTKSCKCCEPCVATDCPGRCVGNPGLCTDDEFIEGNCDGGDCACCQKCQPEEACGESGGSCYSGECPCGLWPAPNLPCNSEACTCCVPCTPSEECCGGPNPGRCVVDAADCDAPDEYVTDDGCVNGDCTCCKTCTPNNACRVADGTCIAGDCPPGTEVAANGRCFTSQCSCCVPIPG